MPHKAKQILDAVYTKLNALESSGVINQLLRSRTEPPSDHPAVVIRMGDDTPANSNANQVSDWEFTIHTDIYVESIEDDLDAKTLAVRTEIHKTLMNDYTQGLPFVVNTIALGQSDPDYTGEGEDYAGATRLSWQIRYRANRQDPTQ